MSLLRKLKESWQPQPLNPPQINPALEKLDGITRSAESIRYSILSVEFLISPKGQVREWLRHNTLMAAWLTVPAVLVVPVVTFVLWQVAKWTTMLTSITGHLIVLPILALLAVVVILVMVYIAKSIFR